MWLAAGAFSMVLLMYIPAPYGKFVRTGYGPVVRSDIGWVIQESPSFIVFLLSALFSEYWSLEASLLGLLFLVHYFNRCFVFPFNMRKGKKSTTLAVIAAALLFTLGNGYLQGRGLFHYDPPENSVQNLSFWAGVSLWALGFFQNVRHDQILAELSQKGEYGIPHGGWFEYVSCANYLSETLEWLGWAIAANTVTAYLFAFWTFANLFPRALSQHRWYKLKFDNYSSLNRRAFIPKLV